MTTNQQVFDYIAAENASNEVVIYSKSYCPYCTETKQFFESLPGVSTSVHELDEMEMGGKIQRALLTMTGQRTVPNVFVQSQHIGGNSDVKRLFANGELQKLVNKPPG